jgi:hypothetical protein
VAGREYRKRATTQTCSFHFDITVLQTKKSCFTVRRRGIVLENDLRPVNGKFHDLLGFGMVT